MADGYRNYGPEVSESPQPISSGGSYSGDERSYESVVVQAEAPVIDWEMNLRAQIGADYGLRQSNQRFSVSCFLGGDFLERSDPSGSYAYPPATVGNENRFYLLADNALINGWHLRIEYSGTSSSGLNLVVLPSPPVSDSRTDLVVLEVWRALVRAAPSSANKSPTSLILRNGNVKAPDSVNLTDDLVDPNYGQESNARIQVQYRLRVVPGVDIDAYPDGIDDPSVVANSVSNFSGPGADGSPTVYAYSVTDHDRSLWRAGAGDSVSSASLGTADGFMYAVPVCAVRRRNSDPFSRSFNMNGGSLIASGTSTRPDGLFADQVVASDVVDLRRGGTSDYEEVLEKAFQQVLDNSMTTRGLASDLGTVGTSFLYKDDIGSASAAPTGTDQNPGNPDGVRRYFSDRSITDTVVFVLNPLSSAFGFDISDVPSTNPSGAAAVPWNTGSTTSILSNAPEGTRIAELVGLRMVKPGGDVAEDGDFDLFDPDNDSGIYVVSVTYEDGVEGTDTMVSVVLNTDATGPVYGEFAIEYPSGGGLSRNVLEAYQLWGALSGLPAWVDDSTWTPAAPSDPSRGLIPEDPTTSFDGSQWWVDLPHRELALRHRSVPVTFDTNPVRGSAFVTGSNMLLTVNTTVNNALQVRTNPSSGFTTITVSSNAAMLKGNPSLVGSNTSASVNTSGADVIRVRTNNTSGFTVVNVPSGASVAKTAIAGAITGAATGLTATVNGSNQLVLTSSTGYIEVDANPPSTLNPVVGLPGGGQVLSSLVAELNFIASPALPSIGASASIVGTNQVRITSNTGYIEVNTNPPSTLNTPVGISAGGEEVGSSYVLVPDRLTGDEITVDDGFNPPYTTTDYTVNTAYTRVNLNFPVPHEFVVNVAYAAYRPAPPISASSSYNAFYRSRAIQSLPPPAALSVSIPMTPRAVGRAMTVLLSGPGSPDDAVPFVSAGDQIPIGLLPGTDYPESRLDGPSNALFSGFEVDTGFMQLTPFLPYLPNPGQVTLYKDVADVTQDGEGRNFWPKSYNISGTAVYSPTVVSQELYYGRRHKMAVPVLMELKEDFDGVGQKGMLVLVVFTAWSDYGPDCKIALLPVLGDSCAAVYRVRGNMMSVRRPSY